MITKYFNLFFLILIILSISIITTSSTVSNAMAQELIIKPIEQKNQTIWVDILLNWTGQLGPFAIQITYDSSKIEYTGNYNISELSNLGYSVTCVSLEKGNISIVGFYFNPNQPQPPTKSLWKIASLEFKVLDYSTNINEIDKLIKIVLSDFSGINYLNKSFQQITKESETIPTMTPLKINYDSITTVIVTTVKVTGAITTVIPTITSNNKQLEYPTTHMLVTPKVNKTLYVYTTTEHTATIPLHRLEGFDSLVSVFCILCVLILTKKFNKKFNK